MMPRPYEKFVLSDNTPRSSKTTINIGGFHVFLYGIDELSPRQAKDTTVIFHIHGRTSTHQDAEDIFHHVLHELRQRGGTKKGVVGVTFDNRNHGLRAIDDIAIQDWNGGNLKHAQDMLSMMDGIVADMQTVMKFLESYVDGLFVPTAYIATGLSLGGHVTWDILADDARIQIAIIIVGSPNLTSMLVDRLARYKSVSDVPKDTDLWPKSIEKLYLERDEKVKRIAGKKILILNGAVDDLVPSKFTIPWMENFSANNDVMFVSQEEAGHALSYEMMQRIVDWLPQWLN